MSDTDDTDVLLLIPPDFFLIHSDSDESYHETSHEYCDPHCGVVDTLITQVHQLESRLNQIEVNAEFSNLGSAGSCNSTVIPMSEMSENPYRSREYNDYIPSSTKSTPQKPKSKQYLSSLPSTPSTERPGSAKYRRPPRFTPKLPPRIVQGASVQSSLQNQSADESNLSSSPEKTDNKRVLGEIDQFLSNVKTIQKVSSKHKDQIPLDKPILTLNDLKTGDEAERRFSQLNLKDVNRLLNQIESQQKFMNLHDRQVESIYENKNFCKSQQSWQCGDAKNSVPDLGFGMRDILYSEDNLPESVNQKPERRDSKSDSQTNSEQTYQTVFEKKSINVQSKSSPAVQTNMPDKSAKNLERQKAEYRETDSSLEAYDLPQDEVISPSVVKSLPTNLSSHLDLALQVPQPVGSVSSINLFSLADIWNSKGSKISEKEMKKLLPKLEEEKCRRKHCEKLIQELQMKILEMQQRLAVAVQVDSAKDEAILRFHEAWEKVANRWKSLESERNKLSQKLLSIEQKSSLELAEATQKVVQYELEMSKALDLARNNQTKASTLEEERDEFVQKIKSLKLELKTSHDNLKSMSNEKEQLRDKIEQLEGQALNDKKLLLETQNEVSKSKTVFLNCQNELSILKDDYIKLEMRIKEKQTAIFDLETQKNTLQITLDNMQKNETQLQKQIKIIQEESERAKHDLRNFYQQQVEILVKDKLKEFQDQLENAEKSLQEELQLREQVIAKTAAKQLQKLSDKHRLEVQLIEEKHKEEIRLYELQFNQMKQQIQLLENKLESYQARRTNIAQELHNIMEQQWLEALRIINNSKSPVVGSPRSKQQVLQQKQQVQQLLQQERESNETLQDFNFTELKNILSSRDRIERFTRRTEEEDARAEAAQKFERDRYNVRFHTNDMPFRSMPEVYETPISSKHKVEPQQPESDLQKYIKLLLDKLPKQNSDKPGNKEERKSQLSSRESSTSDFADVSSSWHQLQTQGPSQKTNLTREQRPGKPPWK